MSRRLAILPVVLLPVLALTAAPGAAAPRKAAIRKPAAKKSTAKPAARPESDPLAAALRDVVRLELAPAAVQLDGAGARQQVAVTAVTRDGATVDVTSRAAFSFSDPRVAKLGGSALQPLSDGETKLTARLGKLAAAPVAVTVANAAAPKPIEFINDVMPVLSRAGCNATACHGSPAGKGTLKLSLFGYEPDLDYQALVKEAEGKHVDLLAPEKSLILRKALGAVPHGGGQRLKAGSPEHRTLVGWLQAGAAGIDDFEARVRSLRVYPSEPWMPAPGARQRLVVVAEMSDGTTRDVTGKALFSSNDDAIADVSAAGGVVAKRPGETAVMIRHLGQVGVARVAVLPTWKLPSFPKLEARGYIDQAVQAKLRKLRVVPSDLCTDEEFIRRATLDVCGIIPQPEEVRAFVGDPDPGKREKLIESLLSREEHVDLWTMRWNDILRNNPRVHRVGTGAYARWIRDQIARNRPYDQFARELLTATGKNADLELDPNNLPPQLQRRAGPRLLQTINRAEFNPAANYYVTSRDPLDTTSATSQVFLGVRIECARCHNHPFEKWTQGDYYALAAYFTGTQTVGPNQAPRVVFTLPRPRPLRHPKTNEVVEPRPLDGLSGGAAAGDRRQAIADWITSPENPWFAKALVNRVWAHYFGRGIVDPVDDFRATNPPSNPELLDALARDFVAHGFDVQHLHRTILNSRTYQQSSRPNQYNRDDTRNFARYYPKRMMAEQLYDSISRATGVYLTLPGRNRRRPRPAAANNAIARALRDAAPDGPVERVMQLPVLPALGRGGAGAGQFLEAFGKPRREVVCECERSSEGNMGQALALINGEEINGKIASRFGRVQQLVRSEQSDESVIEELYVASLSRLPRAMEVEEAKALFRSAPSRDEGIEDLMWSLLNSREFLFVH
ncbi:MAG: DUF1549 and DUF1553 domain-containing protein [Armatimonadota bacterium]